MSEQLVGKWHKRPYGWRADGTVEDSDHAVKVTIRKPYRRSRDSGYTYVLTNGWTVGKNSMRVPAIEGAKFGHTTVTLNYTNTGTVEALASNVKDFVAVVNAQPAEQHRAAMGLSMGGAVTTMALELVEMADLVAPGKYIQERFLSRFALGRQFLAEGLEVFEIGRNPRQAALIGLTSMANCMRRPRAVAAELRELFDGTVHDELLRAKAGPLPPYVRFSYGLNDRLLPAFAQAESIAGLPFDDVMPYEGGHGRLAYDPSLSHEIFKRNARLVMNRELPLAA